MNDINNLLEELKKRPSRGNIRDIIIKQPYDKYNTYFKKEWTEITDNLIWDVEYNKYIYILPKVDLIKNIFVEADNWNKLKFVIGGSTTGDWYLKKNEEKYRKFIYYEKSPLLFMEYHQCRIKLYIKKKSKPPTIKFNVSIANEYGKKAIKHGYPYTIKTDWISKTSYLSEIRCISGMCGYNKIFPSENNKNDDNVWNNEFPIHPLLLTTIINWIIKMSKDIMNDVTLEKDFEYFHKKLYIIPWKELILKKDFNWYDFRYSQQFIKCLEKLEKNKNNFKPELWNFLRHETGWWDIYDIVYDEDTLIKKIDNENDIEIIIVI